MKKLIVPSPQRYECASDYFEVFVTENKAKNSFFSFRYFATLIGWPKSYLSDVTKKRKKLSLQRATEFAEYFKMSGLDKERLIWFSLLEKRSDVSKEFVGTKLDLSAKHVIRPALKNLDIVQHHTMIEVFNLLRFTRKKMTAKEIKENFQIGGFSENDLMQALSTIEKEKLLSWDADGHLSKINGEIPGFDNYNKTDGKPYLGIELHQKYAENFLDFINSPKSPSTYNSSLVEIKKDQFMPIALKIIELRNFILEISEENQRDLKPTEPRRMMQINLDFFSIKK